MPQWPLWLLDLFSDYNARYGSLWSNGYEDEINENKRRRLWYNAISPHTQDHVVIIMAAQTCLIKYRTPEITDYIAELLVLVRDQKSREKTAEYHRNFRAMGEEATKPDSPIKQQVLAELSVRLPGFAANVEKNKIVMAEKIRLKSEKESKIDVNDFYTWKWWDANGNIDHVKKAAYLKMKANQP